LRINAQSTSSLYSNSEFNSNEMLLASNNIKNPDSLSRFNSLYSSKNDSLPRNNNLISISKDSLPKSIATVIQPSNRDSLPKLGTVLPPRTNKDSLPKFGTVLPRSNKDSLNKSSGVSLNNKDSLPKIGSVVPPQPKNIADPNKLSRPDTTKNFFRSSTVGSQNANVVELNSGLSVSYLNADINLNSVEFVSNVLKVYNSDSKPRAFYIDVAIPARWQLITKVDRYFTVNANDTLFIPLRILPRDFKKTSVNYTITTVLISEDGYQIGDASFLAHTTKISKWELNVWPREKIYFTNKSDIVPFSTNIYNNGNIDQSILFYFKEIGNRAIIKDENGSILNDKKREFKLLPGADTTLNFTFTAFKQKRNTQRVDIENYNPAFNALERKYSVIVFTKDAEINNKGSYVKSKRISLIKLPNLSKMSQFGYASLPVIMDLNVFNLIGRQPILNAVFRGSTQLENGGNLTYFFQNNFTSYIGRNVVGGSAFTLGYTKNKINVNIGNVGTLGIGGMSFTNGGGRGINASYQITKNHRLGAYFTRGPQFFNPFFGVQGFGGFYIGSFQKLRVAASAGHLYNNIADFRAVSFGTNLMYTVAKVHNINAGFSGRYLYQTVNPTGTRLDYNANLSYNGQFGKYIREMLTVRYLSIAAVNPNRFRWNVIHRTQFSYFKKLPLSLNNNYSERLDFRRVGPNNFQSVFSRFVANNLNTGFQLSDNAIISPNIFYNFIQLGSRWGHSRGAGLSYNFFNTDTRLRFTYFAQGGYNFLPSLGTPNTFFFNTAAMTQFRTLTFNVRYTYGTGVMDTLNTFLTTNYPQTIGINASYQYALRDERFLLIPFVNYNYVSVRNRHSVGVFPDFYFFSRSGWRFRLSVGSNFSFSERINFNAIVPVNNNNNQNENRWRFSSGINITVGVRKAFGIPIPKKLTKKRFASPTFICFYDFNGNKVYDFGELLIENVVINVGETQVLSNEDGKCLIENIPAGKYKYYVFSLEDLGTWYPVYEDSLSLTDEKKIYVPFVKGVKITGKVVLDREKFSSEVEKDLNLSKIKIIAVDSLGKVYTSVTNNNGEFDIFVPYGRYALSMDESILSSDRYRLLRNNYIVELKDGIDGIFHTFYIVERKRKLAKKKFGSDGKLIEEVIEEQTKPKNGNTPTVPSNKNKTGQTDNKSTNDSKVFSPNDENPADNIKGKTEKSKQDQNSPQKTPGNSTNKDGAGSKEASNKNESANPNKSPNDSSVDKSGVDPNKVRLDPKDYKPEELEKMKAEFLKKTISYTELKGTIFTVQLGAFALPVKPDAFDLVPGNLISERLPSGMIRISSGQFKTYKEAEDYQKFLYSLGYTAEDYVVAYVNGKYKNPVQAKKIK